MDNNNNNKKKTKQPCRRSDGWRSLIHHSARLRTAVQVGWGGGALADRRRRFAGGFLYRMMCFKPPTSTLLVYLCEWVCARGVLHVHFPTGVIGILRITTRSINNQSTSCLRFRHETQESKHANTRPLAHQCERPIRGAVTLPGSAHAHCSEVTTT